MIELYNEDCIEKLKELEENSVHAFISDIPYGIDYEDWDVLHKNSNSALGGSSEHQKELGSLFKRRGKPLNGWSSEDKKIAKEYQEWCSSWGEVLYKVLKPGASVLIFAGRRYAPRCVIALEDIGFTFKDLIAWNKVPAPFRAQQVSKVFERRGDIERAEEYQGLRLGNLAPTFEPILWFQKPYKQGNTLTDTLIENGVGCFNGEILKKNIIECSSKIKEKYHPTQKPVELMKILVELVTLENQTVLDSFMGSGTTGVACKELNRNFIGIEKNKKYFLDAKKRLS